ncbi:MAG TPA: hypothetical protein ENI60_06475 [Candidatus Fraserbacteria bacterium]|nr:hypothetical protein [Candidatus Fraserbacteria bacterium]
MDQEFRVLLAGDQAPVKHSICTHLLDAGADVGFVRNWVGHANIQNTLVYAQLRDQTRDGQARRWLGSERLV